MALQLFLSSPDKSGERDLCLMAAYEDGRVALFRNARTTEWSKICKIESEGWEIAWANKGHKEPRKLF